MERVAPCTRGTRRRAAMRGDWIRGQVGGGRSRCESDGVRSADVLDRMGWRTCTVVVMNPLRMVTTPKLGYACEAVAPAIRSIAR